MVQCKLVRIYLNNDFFYTLKGPLLRRFSLFPRCVMEKMVV